MNVDEKIRELHALGMRACTLAGKDPTNEPRTQYRILPSGKSVIVFYSSCFSFIPPNVNQLVMEVHELDGYIEKAKAEVGMYKQIQDANGVQVSFKSKANVVPFVICIGGVKRIYKAHICKEHQKDRLKYKPKCKCYFTWEEF